MKPISKIRSLWNLNIFVLTDEFQNLYWVFISRMHHEKIMNNGSKYWYLIRIFNIINIKSKPLFIIPITLFINLRIHQWKIIHFIFLCYFISIISLHLKYFLKVLPSFILEHLLLHIFIVHYQFKRNNYYNNIHTNHIILILNIKIQKMLTRKVNPYNLAALQMKPNTYKTTPFKTILILIILIIFV